MTGKTHQIIGITAGLAVYLVMTPPSYNPATLGAVLIASSLGSLLPDADQPGSRIWGYIPFGRVWGEVVNPFLEHRNLSHSFLGVALVGWAIYVILVHTPTYWGIHRPQVLFSFLVAYGSHLLADMVTVQGIPLLFPYQRMFGIPPHPFAGIRIVTGQWFENLIVFPLANALLIALVWTHWHQIQSILFK